MGTDSKRTPHCGMAGECEVEEINNICPCTCEYLVFLSGLSLTIETNHVLNVNADKMFLHSCKLHCAKGTKGNQLGPEGKNRGSNFKGTLTTILK